ncbi:hypothetical protein HPB47_021766 [Ixodes persulcatus]|uniref:Uncharacterized protein n=1 Tax=Ixodes persulcatus TaxID=34615 RepID=A0AC60QEY9_IXOPE|nr:hypothetical protein HPB47_021766 [Ixodes persulcatus]
MVQTLWQTGRTHWQTGGFGMVVTSTSWNWGEGEDELLKGGTVAGGVATRKAREKAARGTGEEHRHAGRRESAGFWRRTPRTQGRWRGDPARGETTQESESLRRRKTWPRSRACCGTPASNASPQEMHGRTCEPRIIKA